MISNLFSSSSKDNLTPLPPKISLGRPSSIHSKSPSPTITSFPSFNQSTIESNSTNSNSIWGTAGLVGREKRESINSVGSRTGLLREFGARRASTSSKVMPGSYDREEQSTTPPRSHPRARITVSSGLISLVMLGVAVSYLVEVCWAILADGVEGIDVFRWVELGCGLLCLLSAIVTIAFIKTRRRSKFSLIFLFLSILGGSFHLLLAITNLLLVFVWKAQLSNRCSWSIDVAWYLGNGGKNCEIGNRVNWRSWIIAAGVRLIVIFIIDAIQLSLLLSFYHALPSSTYGSQPTPITSKHPDFLPSMPDATKYHELDISEATIFDPTTPRASRISNSTAGVGVAGVVWVASKVWEGVGWMFGVKKFDQRDDDEEKGSRGISYRSRRNMNREDETARLSWVLPNQGRVTGLDRVYGDEETRIYAPQDLDDPLLSSFSPLSDSAHQSPHFLIPSSPNSISHTTSSNHHFDSEATEDLHLDAVPFLNGSQSRHYPTGSSGSTGGSLVYVRMSDGKLVRKLSTIASEASGEVYNGHNGSTSVLSLRRESET